MNKLSLNLFIYFKVSLALAAVAQWIECRPVNQKVADWIPVRAHAWVAVQVPSWGYGRGN